MVKNALFISLKNIYGPEWSGNVAISWEETWIDIQAVMRIPFQQAADLSTRYRGEGAPVMILHLKNVIGSGFCVPQLFFRGTCKVWKVSELRVQYEDMVAAGKFTLSS